MQHFVVFLKDYEYHKTIVCVLTELSEAIALCSTLNDKCGKAVSPFDIDEIKFFANENGLNITSNMIVEVNRMGSHFTYEAVKHKYSIDYSSFGADWDDTCFDACTSDMMSYYDYDYDYNPEDDLDENTGIELWIDTSNVSYHKLKKLCQGNNTYKWFDPEFAHEDVALKVAYGDPIHRHCHWEGYRRAKNNIVRLIKKYAKGGVRTDVLCYKIRNNIKYKKNATFKTCADFYLKDIENWIPSEGFGPFGKLDNYVVLDGILWSRDEALQSFCNNIAGLNDE